MSKKNVKGRDDVLCEQGGLSFEEGGMVFFLGLSSRENKAAFFEREERKSKVDKEVGW